MVGSVTEARRRQIARLNGVKPPTARKAMALAQAKAWPLIKGRKAPVSPIAQAIIARTARRKSRRLSIAQAASNQTAWCAASIMASFGTAKGSNAAHAKRRYRAGSTLRS
jgi:hypothetical protein